MSKFRALVGENCIFGVGTFFAIFILLACHKAPETSMDASAASTAPKDTPSTDTPDVPKPPTDKCIVVHTFYQNIYFCCTFFWKKHKDMLQVLSLIIDLPLSAHLKF